MVWTTYRLGANRKHPAKEQTQWNSNEHFIRHHCNQTKNCTSCSDNVQVQVNAYCVWTEVLLNIYIYDLEKCNQLTGLSEEKVSDQRLWWNNAQCFEFSWTRRQTALWHVTHVCGVIVTVGFWFYAVSSQRTCGLFCRSARMNWNSLCDTDRLQAVCTTAQLEQPVIHVRFIVSVLFVF